MSDVNECEEPGRVTYDNNGYCVNMYGSYMCGIVDTKTRLRQLTISMYVYSDQSINKLPILFFF